MKTMSRVVIPEGTLGPGMCVKWQGKYLYSQTSFRNKHDKGK